MLRARRLPPKDIFPVDPWAFEAVRFERDLAERWVGQNETLFALSNGFIGLRGACDEGQPAEEPAVYVNGLYETRPIVYGESAYGFPRHGQSMINAPDGAIMRLFVDDQPFVLTEAEVTDFRRRLDGGRVHQPFDGAEFFLLIGAHDVSLRLVAGVGVRRGVGLGAVRVRDRALLDVLRVMSVLVGHDSGGTRDGRV